MRAVVLAVLVTMGCRDGEPPREDPWPRCRATLEVPLAQLGPLDGIKACRELFRPRCRDALARADDRLTPGDGLEILTRCAAAYCPLVDQPMCASKPTLHDAKDGAASLLAAGLAGVRGSDEHDRTTVGMLLASELLPIRAVTARFSSSSDSLTLRLEGGGAWRVDPAAPDFAPFFTAAIPAGADLGGLLVWGSEDLPADVKHAFAAALSAHKIESVFCSRDARNCR